MKQETCKKQEQNEETKEMPIARESAEGKKNFAEGKAQVEPEKHILRKQKEKYVGDFRFISDSKYFTISVYTVITVFICAIVIRAIFMWDATKGSVQALLGLTAPYIMGIFIASLLYPLMISMEKLLSRVVNDRYASVRRGVSILLTYVIFIGAIVLAIGVILPQVWKSITEMAVTVPLWYRKFVQMLNELNQSIPEIDFNFITQKFQEFGNEFLFSADITNKLQSILVTVISTSFSVVGTVMDILIAFIVSVYLLIDVKRVRKVAKKVLRAFTSEQAAAKLEKVSSECYNIFSSFVTGKLIDSLIIGILCFILMTILKLPYALVISVVVGITNMIPYFGPFIGAVPGALILLMVSPVKMLIYILMILVLQQFDGLYLGPKILGDSTGLRPAWIIFSVAMGGAVAGVIGMFLGVPVVAVIGHLLNIWIEYRLKKKKEIVKSAKE